MIERKMIECKHLQKKQIMLEIILCVLLKILLLTNATVTLSPNDTIPLSVLENLFNPPKLYTEINVGKPTSPRAFVEFYNQFTNRRDNISVTFRWNEPEFTDEIPRIQGYTVQCWSMIEDLNEIEMVCKDKNISKVLEYTVHNLKRNTTYYFRVRAYTKIVTGPYTDLINVSTTDENPIPQLLIVWGNSIGIWDLDLKTFVHFVTLNIFDVPYISIAYSVAEKRIYWNNVQKDIMTLEIDENSITKIISLKNVPLFLSIDWVARNLYWIEVDLDFTYYIMKFDLTMWENGIVNYEKILKTSIIYDMNILPSMGIIYMTQWNKTSNQHNIALLDLDEKNTQIIQRNASNICTCSLNMSQPFYMEIENTNTKKPLLYLLFEDSLIVADISICNCNLILQAKNIGIYFSFLKIDKTNIYISSTTFRLIVLKKKYALLESKDNALKYIQMIRYPYVSTSLHIFNAFKSLQTYPPTRCLIPDEKFYTIEVVTENSIIVNLPESVPKSGCKKYNLPTTMYTIYVSHCSDNNFNKTEKFNVQMYERYYEIKNVTPLTEYKLTLTLSNFYFDRLSMKPFSSTQSIKTKPGKLNAPENVTVQALTPTVAAVHWMPPKKLNCIAVIYKVYWESIILMDDLQQKGEQFINTPKRIADGRFFTKIQLSLPIQGYLIYVRVYPANFSDFYNDSSSKIIQIYSEPNNISLSRVNVNSMNISWTSNIEQNLKVFCALEYKNVAIERWQITDFIKTKYNKEVVYHIENLQPGTSYKFRLILKYPEYEEIFIWPADERFTFSTIGISEDNISNTPGASRIQPYYLILILSLVTVICICYFYCLYRQRNGDNSHNTDEYELDEIKRH